VGKGDLEEQCEQAVQQIGRIRRTLDPGFQSSATVLYPNSLSGAERAGKRPQKPGFANKARD